MEDSTRQFLRSRRAHNALTSRSSHVHITLTSRSRRAQRPKSGEHILGAHATLTLRSNGENCAQMGKIALLAR